MDVDLGDTFGADGRDGHGNPVQAGVYYIRHLETDRSHSNKVVVVR